MGLRDNLCKAGQGLRCIAYGAALGPLVQRLYESGFKSYDHGALDSLIGADSQLPDCIAAGGFLLGTHMAGKAIDRNWPRILRGSLETALYAGLIYGVMYGGDYLCQSETVEAAGNTVQALQTNQSFAQGAAAEVPQTLYYLSTVKENLLGTISSFSEGKVAPLIYTVLYGGLLSSSIRWASNLFGYVVKGVNRTASAVERTTGALESLDHELQSLQDKGQRKRMRLRSA